MQMENVNIAIIGAGVVGLAVAAKISRSNDGVFVFEKNAKFGQETSSHNSGVVHSGIHYPPGSLKAKLCVEGNTMLRRICEENRISYKPLGKLTVAITEEESAELDKLMKMGTANAVADLKFLNRAEIKKLEPNIDVQKALYTPTTGIVEPDELMHHFHSVAQRNNVVFAMETEVKGLRKTSDGFELAGTSVGEAFAVKANTVINCTGLNSDKVAAMTGLDVDRLGYRLHHCKGDYFRLAGKPPVTMLVYPVPKGAGLGIHLTPDMSGSVRLGPNAYYVETIDYNVKSSEKEFREDVERFLPSIHERQIHVDSAGIRPKLQGPNDGFKDFVIKHEAENGLTGFINLVGIESPGLTAAPSIANLVSQIYEQQIKK